MGRRFAQKGSIDQPEDVFMLNPEEVEQAAMVPESYDMRWLTRRRHTLIRTILCVLSHEFTPSGNLDFICNRETYCQVWKRIDQSWYGLPRGGGRPDTCRSTVQ